MGEGHPITFSFLYSPHSGLTASTLKYCHGATCRTSTGKRTQPGTRSDPNSGNTCSELFQGMSNSCNPPSLGPRLSSQNRGESLGMTYLPGTSVCVCGHHSCMLLSAHVSKAVCVYIRQVTWPLCGLPCHDHCCLAVCLHTHVSKTVCACMSRQMTTSLPYMLFCRYSLLIKAFCVYVNSPWPPRHSFTA